MAVKWLREKCLFLPVWPPWRAPRCCLTLACPRVWVRVRVSFTTGAVQSAILATAGLLVIYLMHKEWLCLHCHIYVSLQLVMQEYHDYNLS